MTTEIRPFGIWTASAFVVGSMIGSGIFLLPISIAPFGWTGVIGWIISITGVLCIAYTLGRLSDATPEASGAIAVAGAALGPVPGVLVGWSYWVGCWAANAAIAIAATSYIVVFVPALNATPLAGALTSVTLIWLLTLLNMRGAKAAGQFQVVTTALKLLPLIVVIGILAALAYGGSTRLPPLPGIGTAFSGLTAVVTLTLFPLLGFECASIAAGRVHNPGSTIMRATMLGTAVVGLIYLIVCTGIVATLPMAALQASAAPFQLFVETYWGRGPALAVAAFAAIAAIGALNAFVLLQGETPLAMARAGLLPGWFAGVNRRDVPVGVHILSSVLSSLLVLSNASKSLSGVFEFAALVTTCSSLWLYVAICLGALFKRVAVPFAAIGLPFTAWAMWGAGVEAAGLAFVLMLTGLPLYWRRSGHRPLAEQPA
ncbi:APC family permease [Sphingomonas sp. 28-63-12]|uniref:APC family permease n=1 Tax=Sphingomonas sp. 28-63-12 TaxID=1970434 RepID=UPI000BD3779E|nr:MAG: hypothetical protein B7Y47_05285 [Sphingomonas sp. 28-63-12]